MIHFDVKFLCVVYHDGKFLYGVKEDGTPEFGEGFTEAKLKQEFEERPKFKPKRFAVFFKDWLSMDVPGVFETRQAALDAIAEHLKRHPGPQVERQVREVE